MVSVLRDAIDDLEDAVFSRGEEYMSDQPPPSWENPLVPEPDSTDGVWFWLTFPLGLLWWFWRLSRYKWKRFRQFHPFRCPFCFSQMDDYYIACRRCHRIQGSLSPSWYEFRRKCQTASCSTRFGHLNDLTSLPRNAQGRVCRSTRGYTGCRRVLPAEIPFGRYQNTYLTLCGPTTWEKLAVMAMAWLSITDEAKSKGWWGVPRWDQTELELEYLSNRIETDPESLKEKLVKQTYTLARTAVFEIQNGQETRLLQIHNIPEVWCQSEETLLNQALYLEYDQSLLFVFDLKQATRRRGEISEAATLFSRYVRVLERYHRGSLLRPFPGRVAVAVPGWRPPAGVDSGSRDAMAESAQIEENVRQCDPHFWGLVKAMIGPNARYFGGEINSWPDANSWTARMMDFLID